MSRFNIRHCRQGLSIRLVFKGLGASTCGVSKDIGAAEIDQMAVK